MVQVSATNSIPVQMPEQRIAEWRGQPLIEKSQAVHRVASNEIETRTYLYDQLGRLVRLKIQVQTLNILV